MRLIDADTLLQDLENDFSKVNKEKLSENDYLVIRTAHIALSKFIKKQSTAYEEDKVLKQLEDESKKCSICELPTCKEDESHCCYCNGLNKAIEIVKAGGMNNNSKTSD